MLSRRILTAFLLLPIILAIIFFAPYWLFALFLLTLLAIAGYEWCELSHIHNKLSIISYIAGLYIVTLGSYFVPVSVIFICAFLWWCFASFMIFVFPKGKTYWQRYAWMRLFVGILILVPFIDAIDYLWLQPSGSIWLTYILTVIWCADTSAYFIGSRFGKTKLAPLVSPKKSVQGLLGGIAGGLLIYVIFGCVFQSTAFFSLSFLVLMIVSILFSVSGDLTESMVKRFADVKDSSQLLPGHGGILDRIDSLTAAVPIFAMGLWLLSS